MPLNVVMPALEMAQETGKILAWLKKEGEPVAKGEPLLEIETDKAVVEVEAQGDGILAGVCAVVGAVVPVGETIAWLLKPGEAVPAEAAKNQSGRSAVSSASGGAEERVAATTSTSASAINISPKARRLASEKGVDPARVRGSGPGGEILAADILAAAEAASASAAAPDGGAALNAVARLMAERTTQSWTTVPHFFVTREVDAGPLVEWHRQLRAAGEASGAGRLTITDLLIVFVASTLRKHPRLNSSWTGQGIAIHADVNIGVAMAVEGGVVAAVIHQADTMSLGEIGAARGELADRARSGKLRPSDIAGGTFTISNLGMHGVDSFTAILVPPQAGILAVGRIADRVAVVKGKPAVRPMLTLTLSCDHRVVDGAAAAQFMKDLAESIAEPPRRAK